MIKKYLKEGKSATPTRLTSVGIAGVERKPGEKMKYKELLANTVTFISYVYVYS